MKPNELTCSHQQELVNEFFSRNAVYWKELYAMNGLFAIIHQQRYSIALRYIQELPLQKHARVLEIGCGAGLLSAELARNGFSVESIDCSKSMVRTTYELIKNEKPKGNVELTLCDAHSLPFREQSFDLVVALGVIPWLYNLRKSLTEINRVLKNEGYILLNSDNNHRLNGLLDVPTLAKELIKNKVIRADFTVSSTDFPSVRMYSNKQFDRYLHEAKLNKIKTAGIGFGPFSLFNHYLFSDTVARKFNKILQYYADKGNRFLRDLSSLYIVVAKKSGELS